MRHSAVHIDEILERYPERPEYLIFLLQDIQEEFGYVSAKNMEIICDHIEVPLSQAYSVATFYQSFRLEPKGEHEIRVCLGTACYLKGSQRIIDELERRLGVGPGCTSDDMRYTLETVNCVGACSLAPVIVVDEEYKPNTTVMKLKKILHGLEQE